MEKARKRDKREKILELMKNITKTFAIRRIIIVITEEIGAVIESRQEEGWR